jgi:hypothetical protein
VKSISRRRFGGARMCLRRLMVHRQQESHVVYTDSLGIVAAQAGAGTHTPKLCMRKTDSDPDSRLEPAVRESCCVLVKSF